MRFAVVASFFILFLTLAHSSAFALEPIPDKLVILTFDDSVKSHYSVARPILKKYRFGASFFITEGFTFKTNKADYMTWDEIKALHDDGFDIGNHTLDHMTVEMKNVHRLEEQLRGIDISGKAKGVPPPMTFAWPGRTPTESAARQALPILKQHGIRFARRSGKPEFRYEEGRGVAYEPGKDHPLLIPTTGDARPLWQLKDFVIAVEQARDGKIAVLQFHGVPEGEHPWVHTPRERFEEYMKYLHDHGYRAISLRDLAQYVDPNQVPADPWGVIRERTAKKQ